MASPWRLLVLLALMALSTASGSSVASKQTGRSTRNGTNDGGGVVRPLPADPEGNRAAALQRHVDEACARSGARAPETTPTIELSGTYNFSAASLTLTACAGVALVGTGPQSTVLLFQGGERNPPHKDLVHAPGNTSAMRPGYILHPNPRSQPGKPMPNAAACQQACAAVDVSVCAGAVYMTAAGACYQLAADALTSAYPSPGCDSWTRVPVHEATGPGPAGGWTPPGGLISGVNATNSANCTLSQFAIDYDPKPRSLFCFADTCPEGPLGITLHFHNSSGMVAEDVTIHAAPYMACTSFNGDGGHILRRVVFQPNEPGQLFVSERDGIHESDVRRGITVEDSTVYGQRDDFFNVHSTLLVVMRCGDDGRSCVVINPHVEDGRIDTTYGTNSLLGGARQGDALTIVPFIRDNETAPKRLDPLAAARLNKATRVTDNATLEEAVAFATALHGANPKGSMAFCGAGHAVDVWTLTFAEPLTVGIPPASLLSVDSLTSAGAVIRGTSFNFSTASMRFKSSGGVIANNSVANEGCTSSGCDEANLEITYLQTWFEGGALIRDVSVVDNTFELGAGVDPVHANPIDTSGIVVQGNRFLPKPSSVR